MPGPEVIFGLLSDYPQRIVDRALVEAIPTADPAAAGRIVAALLERRSGEGLRGLVHQFHCLPASLRQSLLEHSTTLDAALRETAGGKDTRARLNMVEIVTGSHAFRLAYLLTDQLAHEEASLSRSAASSLLQMTNSLCTACPPAPSPVSGHPAFGRDLELMVAAIVQACANYYRHRRREVLLAACQLMRYHSPRLVSVLTDRRSSVHEAMRELLAKAESPEVVESLLLFAPYEALQGVVGKALASPLVARHRTQLLRQAHLLVVPGVEAVLGRLRNAEALVPSRQELDELDPSLAAAAAKWIAALPLDEAKKIAAVSELLTHLHPLARLAGLRQLIRFNSVGADQAIVLACSDPDASIARWAVRHLMRQNSPELPKVMAKLIDSPHAHLRQIVQRQWAPREFERWWDHYLELPMDIRRAAGLALLKVNPQFLRQLAGKLLDPVADWRLKAVMIARELDQQTYFEPQLLALVDDPDKKVVSAACKALGAIADSDRAAAALARALHHADDRVRSNAIEALEQMHKTDQVRPQLQEIAVGHGNRSRATAIRALMNMPLSGAVPALLNMLSDADSKHRVSALWAAQQSGLLNLAQRVAVLAKDDPQPDIRRRALDVIRHMAKQHMSDSAGPEHPQPSEAAAPGGGA